MSVGTSFPATRDELHKLHIHGNGVRAEAILLAPEWGRGHQRITLLAGSRIAPKVVNTCPGSARKHRNWLKDLGLVVQRGGNLILVADAPCTSVSLAAQTAMGASKNGWDFWQYHGRSLDDMWGTGDLVFYDPADHLPSYAPPPASAGEVFSVRGEKSWVPGTHRRILATSQYEIDLHHLPEGESVRVCDMAETIVECRSGKLMEALRGSPLTPGESVVLQGEGCAHILCAVENSVFTTTRLIAQG